MADIAVTKQFLTSFMTTKGARKVFGVFKVVLDGTTYATGGLEVDLSPYMSKVDVAIPVSEAGSGYSAEIDDATFSSAKPKLMLFYADYDAGTDGALIQHPASAVTATYNLLVIGS